MKIGINCGHTKSGAGCGAVGYINESEETRAVGNKLIEMLKRNGHTVVNCTVNTASTQNEYLKKSVLLANAQSLDYFISIHFNAGGGKGVETFTYSGKKLDVAKNICSKIESLGFKNRGVKDGSDLYVIKNTKAKAILIEVCFVDTESDVQLYHKVGADKIATAIYESITGKEDKGSNTMQDIKGHWAEASIKSLYDKGIVTGDNNGKFNPDKTATKAEVATMIDKTLKYLGK